MQKGLPSQQAYHDKLTNVLCTCQGRNIECRSLHTDATGIRRRCSIHGIQWDMKSKRKERERMGDASRVAHFAGIQKINKNAEQNEFHCWP